MLQKSLDSMANNKTGFAFYNLDTNRYQDIRIKRLKKDFSCNGIAVYDYILCEIYRVKGCFLMWDASTAFDVADYFGLKETTVNEIVNYCCSVGLFNKALLASESVLTSRSIQNRFIEMSTRAKRKDAKIPEKILIIQEGCEIIPEQCNNTSGSLPQSRVKKSRVKKSRVLGADAPPTQNEIFFKNFHEWITKTAPNVGKMKEPFTIDQFLKLKSKFSSEQIKSMVLKMHNYKPLLSKNNSAYLTFLNWMERDHSATAETTIENVNERLKSAWTNN